MKLFMTILFLPLMSLAKLNVTTTTSDLGALVKAVGKDQVEVFSIGKGTQDPHHIDAKPSFIVKMRDSDLVVAHGLELESAWLGPLITGARNPKLSAKNGVLELAAQLDPIEIPKAAVTRAAGDVHPGGNPHFQLDPIRLGQAALLIADRLSELDSARREYFTSNAKQFQKQMQDKTKEWKARLQRAGIQKAVTYHKTFSYFCDRFSIQCDMQLEPKPGIPPSASHLIEVIDQMRKQNINLVLIENLYEDSVDAKLEQALPGVKIKHVAVSVDGEPGLSTNEQLIEALVRNIEDSKNR
jgi:zinc/manganese transport system substrate-binding protein